MKEFKIIYLSLNDILGYAESVLEYLKGNEELDKKEIIMYLSVIPEIIKEIEEKLIKIERKVENE